VGPDARRSESRIAVRVHPPERRRRAPGIAACGSCCCCCCLHSLGGLIAASTAGRSRSLEEHRATTIYWSCLFVAIAITGLWISADGGDALFSLLMAAFLLPGYQIATSVVAAIIAGLLGGRSALLRIWRITWRGFLGALIGMGLMVALSFGGSLGPLGFLLTVLVLCIAFGYLFSILRKRAAMSPVRQ
jgi:hypothetical protein